MTDTKKARGGVDPDFTPEEKQMLMHALGISKDNVEAKKILRELSKEGSFRALLNVMHFTMVPKVGGKR